MHTYKIMCNIVYWIFKKSCLVYFIIDDVPLFKIKMNFINFDIQTYSSSTTTVLIYYRTIL